MYGSREEMVVVQEMKETNAGLRLNILTLVT